MKGKKGAERAALAERQKAARERRVREAMAGPGTYRAVHCAVEDLLPEEVSAGTVDAIFTDPPYPRKYLPVWSDLAEFAVGALRPGGTLATMSGQSFLPEVLQRLAVPGLSYRWTLAVIMPGVSRGVWGPRVANTRWKPVIVLTKDGADPDRWIAHDFVRADPLRRQPSLFHHWGQNPSSADGIWEKLQIPPGSTVVDPFAGGGEMALTAYRAGCHVLAADCDPHCAALAGLDVVQETAR